MNGGDCVAMLLAGGEGKRLGALTEETAKAVVRYGGKYRAIDFTLSNLAHSGIHAVGVLTQYRKELLHNYIGSGKTWGLDRQNKGVFLLPPPDARRPYTGTGDAVAQNIGFLDVCAPRQVLVAAADHVYTMDYRDMLSFHHKNGADITIAAIAVPKEEASRFGVLEIAEQGRVTAFQEKPAQPGSTLVSMGVYIFEWDRLRRFLLADKTNRTSSHDFGGDLLPAMLAAGERVFCYRFPKYWKDVGTVHSLWQSNMDLLSEGSGLDLYEDAWTVLTESSDDPPCYISEKAQVHRSVISDGCKIFGKVINSVLSEHVCVGEGAEIVDSVILPGALIHKNARIRKAIVGAGAWIGRGAVVGGDIGADMFRDEHMCPEGISLIGPDVCIFDNAAIRKGAHIGKARAKTPELAAPSLVLAI